MNKNTLKVNRNVWFGIISIFLLVGILGFFFIDRKKNDTIVIGFSAQLSGRQAELGVQERNGVQLAVEKINESGGIAGRKVSLIIHDDVGMHYEAQYGDKELIEKGAVAIIGHATTSQTLSGIKVTNPAKVVMISPTVSTPELTGLDDYFFRVHPDFKDSAKTFAQYINKQIGITRIAVIYDKDNLAYSKTYSKIFEDKFQSLGGNITDEVGYSSVRQTDFSSLLSNLRESNAEGLLIVASDIDTALIAQRARLMGWQIPVFTSAWAQTKTLINNGGQAVEGMILEQAFDLNTNSEVFVDFKAHYKARFGNEPSFGAAYSYEAALVLIEALKKTNGNKNGLKEALLETEKFDGLMDRFSLNKYGDVVRPWYLSTIKDGKFIMVDKLTYTSSGGE